MCDIKKISRLKTFSKKFIEEIEQSNPLHELEKSHVSDSGLTYTDLYEKINKIKSCSSIIELKEQFIETGKNEHDQILSVSKANFCKQHAVCPICADRSQSRRRARFSDPIKLQAKQVSEGKKHAYIVTKTIESGEDLAERLDFLKGSKKAFRLMGQKRKAGRSNGEEKKVVAAISSIEVKRGSGSRLWHVHSHELVFTDSPFDYQVYDSKKRNHLKEKYGNSIPKNLLNETAIHTVEFRGDIVPASKISLEWLAATGGESMGISVEPLQHIPKTAKGSKKRKFQKMSFEDSICYQAKEVLKYQFKPQDNQPDDVITIISDTYNKRMVATYGEFRGVPGDDYIDPANEQEQTFVVMWDNAVNKYGEPVPGKIREVNDMAEEEKETRKKVGVLLGQFRRQKRIALENKEKYGSQLYITLDMIKDGFRQKISAVWAAYRNKLSANKRLDTARCDKYSPVLATLGMYYPDSTSHDVYSAAFI